MRLGLLISLAASLALVAAVQAMPAQAAMGIGPAISLGSGASAKPGATKPAKAAPARTAHAADAPAAAAGNGSASGAAGTLFSESFDSPDGLLANDFSHWNPGSAEATASPGWEVTSGSLFVRDDEAWTGVPDGCADSSPHSSPCTASAVFRLNTTRHDFGDVAVSLDLVNERLLATSRTPAVAWDGVHIWLRHQSEYSLYAASVNRRDGHVVIKKKCPGGSENGGTYYELGQGEIAGLPIPFGAVQHLSASAQNNADGSVTIAVTRNGAPLVAATDRGLGCAPIASPGAIGVRGDNDEFSFDNLVVTADPASY